jgi:hypothetical protein
LSMTVKPINPNIKIPLGILYLPSSIGVDAFRSSSYRLK